MFFSEAEQYTENFQLMNGVKIDLWRNRSLLRFTIDHNFKGNELMFQKILFSHDTRKKSRFARMLKSEYLKLKYI